MPSEAFKRKSFNEEKLDMINQANRIITRYQARGFKLTLRQLYYQFVARDLFPSERRYVLVGKRWVRDPTGAHGGSPNATPNYDWLGDIINDARLAGYIDWSAIEDRTRNVRHVYTNTSPTQAMKKTAEAYKEDLWRNQTNRPEVWIEKDALVGVIEPVCKRFRVPFFACRGYNSQSEQYAAGKRFVKYIEKGQEPIVLHLGDHDPSGVNMTEDNIGRLSMFARAPIDVRRLALNMNQVRQYNPPPNPVKESDGRSRKYQEKYGDECWELDALDPTVISRLISDELKTLIDLDTWKADLKSEKTNRQRIEVAADAMRR